MASRYLMQIVDRDTGDVVQFEPGTAIERDFVSDIVRKTSAKGVGLGRTTSHVVGDVRAAIEEAIFELKAQVARRRV